MEIVDSNAEEIVQHGAFFFETEEKFCGEGGDLR